jgi:bile acid:Na+ symporter, BASS family
MALLLTKMLRLPETYAVGLMFLGMAPCAPFLPRMAERAGGDFSYVATFIFLTAVGDGHFYARRHPFLSEGFIGSTAKTCAAV